MSPIVGISTVGEQICFQLWKKNAMAQVRNLHNLPARVQIWINCHEHRLHAKNFANNWWCMLQNATHSFSDANFKMCCIKLWCHDMVTASLLNFKGNEVTTHNEANSCYLWTITLKNHIGMTQSSCYFSSLSSCEVAPSHKMAHLWGQHWSSTKHLITFSLQGISIPCMIFQYSRGLNS